MPRLSPAAPKHMPVISNISIQVKAVLFDLDGTLVDTTVASERTWRAWAARYGVDPDAALRVCQGRRTLGTVLQFAPAGIDPIAEITLVEEEMTRDTDGVVPGSGAKALLGVDPAGPLGHRHLSLPIRSRSTAPPGWLALPDRPDHGGSRRGRQTEPRGLVPCSPGTGS
jgi:hypothetical protein